MNSDHGANGVVSPGELPPVATEDALAETLDALVNAPADSTASPPDDPLYDSARAYLQTVDRVRARADGGDSR